MKSQKGITMSALVIYIVVTFMVIAMLTTLTINYRSTIKDINDDSKYESDYSKFNLYFLEETSKKGNNIKSIESDKHTIKFESGTEFKYSDENKTIYLNQDIEERAEGTPAKRTIKLLEQVEKCEFVKSTENGKSIIIVTIKIGTADEKTMKYTVNSEGYSNSVNTENDYIGDIIKIPEKWDSSKLNSKDPFRTENINGKTNIAPIPNGYEVSNVEGEDKISKGLIITDGTNRFKWYQETSEELSKYTEENLGTEWNPADSTGLSTNTEIYNSFQGSKTLYGGVYIKEDTETIKTILWLK